ncbi:carbon-nitrogen hydrolase family protein [Pseudomonas sp. Fl5BN2]|uniref:carbon-nitrogen hydrolase family protein n=1 Tax=unclassified Pseudomonas TaxID=196821 RepID=UPI0013781170|nr:MULTISPECIES: carbon-nitrogen hydrolase family protein [unclassified Pseudomonas]NBF04162.1 carbon-nitrogen hydrolase family protein [Pseudomonas sp. Fl5BN2]NBF09953.1 carbon-nitrogen hydrolase family protein [Pseudomonas sp. Fl4BN1]
MRKLLYITFTLALLAAITSYALWTRDRPGAHYLSDLRIQLAVDQGVPADHGNLLAIEPELFPTDYQSTERLHRKLAAYLQQARDHGLVNDKTIVVLPEHVGTWLMVSGEKNELYQATSLKEAMNWLAVSNPLPFLKALITAKGESRLDDAHLRMKAKKMAKDYQLLFGGLAKEFHVTLVAGSIILPEPSVNQGNLQIGSGALYNSSLVFGSDGLPIGQPQRQIYPTYAESGYVHGDTRQSVQVIDTPAGRLGVLIGSDSWYPDNYRKLNEQDAQLVAVPAFVMGKGSWEKPWHGYKSITTPSEVSLKPEETSEGDAWHRLTLTARPPSSLATAGVSVFLRGHFWDQSSSGHSFINSNGQTFADEGARGARLLNIWL